MTNGTYDSRKEQIEKEFLRGLMKALNNQGFAVTLRGRNLIREELKMAAMVGAVEERYRILNLPGLSDDVKDMITEVNVLDVLGYGEDKAK